MVIIRIGMTDTENELNRKEPESFENMKLKSHHNTVLIYVCLLKNYFLQKPCFFVLNLVH